MNEPMMGNFESVRLYHGISEIEVYLREKVTPAEFHNDMESLLGDYRPDKPDADRTMLQAFSYMAQMLAWTGYRDGAEVALLAAKKAAEVK